MVTSSPRPRAVAATSAPMNPAPTTTTRRGVASNSARMARLSASVRKVYTPARCSVPGKVRVRAPVAITTPSAARRSPSLSVTVREAASKATARVPSRHVNRRSSSAPAS